MFDLINAYRKTKGSRELETFPRMRQFIRMMAVQSKLTNVNF
ncbi:MAG: hypothetical protein ACRC5V_01435 [Aeromonas sp.]